MRFTFYTEKTVAQCVSALNERLKGSRANLDGQVDKSSGEFTLAYSSKVARWFKRTTRLYATIEREAGSTIIKGYVPDGVERQNQFIIWGAALVAAIVLFALENAILALLSLLVALVLYIPTTGDYHNHTILLREVKSILKARESAGRKPAQIKSAATRPKSTSTSPVAKTRSTTPSPTPFGAAVSSKKPLPPRSTPPTKK
jgi:hypothetical protein